MLGVNKKGKMEAPKSIQLAAAVAKKVILSLTCLHGLAINPHGTQQQDRRAARLKEMEARRQAVLQKKAEEEERKAREDAERRKKEREENTSKRPLVRAESKVSFRGKYKGNTNRKFVVTARRRRTYKEKEGYCRSSQSQAAVEGEKGCACNPYHKAWPDLGENNDRDEAAIYHIAQPSYERQGPISREAWCQTGSWSCLG